MENSFSQNKLKPLRSDLELHKGPRDDNGAPTWTVFDPITNKFYRLGWLEIEILSRWHLKIPEKILENILDETTLKIEIKDIENFALFLQKNNLLEGYTSKTEKHYLSVKRSVDGDWVHKVLRQYMFFRIPLFNPESFLEFIKPITKHFFKKAYFNLILVLFFIASFLIIRQWDDFSHSFVDFFSFYGLVLYFFMVVFAKSLHEIGHAIAANHYGCRVPKMGIALMVFFPVLYTDTTDAWKLSDKKSRLMISASGILSELALAVIAALFWVFLPDGPLRGAVFLIASTTWILTLFVNLNPFMRFDGYFILSDWLEIDNLHKKAKLFARDYIFRLLFKTNTPKPTHKQRNFLTFFGFGILAYRIFIFGIISFLIYKITFKALAICLITMNFYFMILSPSIKNFLKWKKVVTHGLFKPHMLRLASFSIFIGLIIFLPWKNHINLEAAIYPFTDISIYAELPSIVEEINVTEGQWVKKGAPLIKMRSPKLELEIKLLENKIDNLHWQYGVRHMDPQLQEKSLVIKSEIENTLATLKSRIKKKQQLSIKAPYDGNVSLSLPYIKKGTWVRENEKILNIYNFDKLEIKAYLNESQINKMQKNAIGHLYLNSHPNQAINIKMKNMEVLSVNQIKDPLFASIYNGPIAVRIDKNNNFIPEIASFPIQFNTLKKENLPFPIQNIQRGKIILDSKAESIFIQIVEKTWSVFIRESGF